MLNDLYSYIESKIIEEKIYDEDVIKSKFILGITDFFEKSYPEYINNPGIESIIKHICHNIGKIIDQDEVKLYKTMCIELEDYVPNWQLYTDIESFILKLVEAMVLKFNNNERINFKNVIFHTLKSNSIDGVDLNKEKNLRLAISKLLKKYFYDDKIILFTRSHGARQYMLSKSKDEILDEMAVYLEYFKDEADLMDIDVLISEYVDKLTSELLNKKEGVSTR